MRTQMKNTAQACLMGDSQEMCSCLSLHLQLSKGVHLGAWGRGGILGSVKIILTTYQVLTMCQEFF